MAFYREFTSPRITQLHLPSLVQTLRSQDVTAGVVVGNQAPPDTIYIIKKATDFTTPQITFIQNSIDTSPLMSPRLSAKDVINSWPIEMRALLYALIDQLNTLRTFHSLPAITPAQALTAILNKADTL